MKTQKKAQITIFMIMGILLLVGAIFFFIAQGKLFSINVPNSQELSVELRPVFEFETECVKIIGEQALAQLGLHNGIEERTSFARSYGNINYAYLNEDLALDTRAMKQEIANYMEQNMDRCLKNYESFPDKEVKTSPLKANVEFTKKETIITVDHALTVSEPGFSGNLRYFRSSFGIRIGTLQSIVKDIAENYGLQRNTVELMQYLGNLDVNSYVLPYEDDFVFVLEDVQSTLYRKPYVYLFAIRK